MNRFVNQQRQKEHSFFAERKMVFFADLENKTNTQSTENTKELQEERQEERQEELHASTNQASEEKKKKEIRERIEAIMQENNKEGKKAKLQALEEEYGVKISEVLEDAHAFGFSRETQEEIKSILQATESSKEKTVETIFRDKIKTGEKTFSEKEEASILSLSPLQVKSAFKNLPKNYWEYYINFFQTLNPQKKEVQHFIEHHNKQHGQNALAVLPPELRSTFATLSAKVLFEKGEITLKEFQERTRAPFWDSFFRPSSSDTLLSGKEKEQKMFLELQKEFGKDHPALIAELKKITEKNTEEDKKSVIEAMIETVVAYLKTQIKENTEISLSFLKKYTAQCKFIENLILTASQEFISPEKKSSLQTRIANVNTVVEKIFQAIAQNSRTALADSQEAIEQIETIEEKLAHFHHQKTFGHVMIKAHEQYSSLLKALIIVKNKYRTKQISKDDIAKTLQKEYIVIDAVWKEKFFNDEIDHIPPHAIRNLDGLLPESWQEQHARKALEPYIINPLAHTSGISKELLSILLQNKNVHPEVIEIFKNPVSITGAEKATAHLSHHLEMMINETETELRGQTESMRYQEAMEAFFNGDTFKKMQTHIHSVSKTILEKLNTISPDADEIKEKIIQSLAQLQQSFAFPADAFQSEFKKSLESLRTEFRQEASQEEVDSFLRTILEKKFLGITSTLDRFAYLAANNPKEFKRTILEEPFIPAINEIDTINPKIGFRGVYELPDRVRQEIANEEQIRLQCIPEQNTLFSLLAYQKGWSHDAIVMIQKLIANMKNKKGTAMIIPSSTALEMPHYDEINFQLVLPKELYEKFVQYPENKTPIREKEFTILWHEISHFWVDTVNKFVPMPDGKGVIERFNTHIEKHLSTHQNTQYQHLKQEFSATGIAGDASSEEEMLVMIFAELQKTKAQRAQYLSTTSRTKGNIINDIITLVQEKNITDFFQKETQNLITQRSKKFPTYFSSALPANIPNASNDALFKKAANQETGNRSEEEIAKEEEEKKRQEEIYLLENYSTPQNNNSNENSPMTAEKRQKKIGEYQKKAKEMEEKISKINALLKGQKSKGIAESIEYCQKVLAKGEQLIRNPALVVTSADADRIITQLENRASTNDDDDEEKKQKKGTDKTSVKGILDTIIQRLNDFPEDNRSYLAKMWHNTDFLAMKDFGILKNTLLDYIKRRWKDQQSLRVNKVGKNITPKIWGLAGLENEFSNAAEGAHNKIVGAYASAIKNETNSYISKSFLPAVKNKEALRAAIEHLVKGGNMDWQSAVGKTIAQKLEEFGSGITFDPKHDFKLDGYSEMILRLKFKKAINRVYGDETLFDKWYNENMAANNGSVEKGKSQVSVLNYQEDQIQQWIRHVSVYHANDDDNGSLKKEFYVKKQILEGYIYGTLDDGNFENAQRAMYYLIMGVAQGALQPKAVDRAWATLVGKYPAFQFTNGATKAQCIAWQKEILWDAERQEFLKPWEAPPEWFDAWLDSKMMTADSVVHNRMQKVENWKMDHDNSYFTMSTGTADLAKRMLLSGHGGTEGGNHFKQMPSGSLRYFSSLALTANQLIADGGGSETVLRKNIIRHSGFYTALQGLGTQSIVTPNNERRPYEFTRDVLEDEPRGSGKGYNDSMKVKDYFSAQNALFTSLIHLPNQHKDFAQFLDLVYGSGKKLTAEDFATKWNELYAKSAALQVAFEHKDVSLKARSDTFFTQIVPYVLDYFIGEKENGHPLKAVSDVNYTALLKNITDLSVGKGIAGIKNSEHWRNKNANAILKHNDLKYKSKDPKLEMYKKMGELKWDLSGNFKGVAKK